MFDPMSAKKDMLQEIMKLAGQSRAEGLKAKYTPSVPPTEGAPGEEPPSEAPEGVDVEVEGNVEGEPSPDVLAKLLELLGG